MPKTVGNYLHSPQQWPTTQDSASRFIARAVAVSLVALAIFATVAVSVPSAGAPAWLMGAALFFESLAAPSLLGSVLSVKAVVFCLAGLTLLLAGDIAFISASDKPKVRLQDENLRQNQALARPSYQKSAPVSAKPSVLSSPAFSSVDEEEDYDDPLLYDIVCDDSPAPSLGRPEFIGERPTNRFYSSGTPLKREPNHVPGRPGLHIGRRMEYDTHNY